MLTRNFYVGLETFLSNNGYTGITSTGNSVTIGTTMLGGNTSTSRGVPYSMIYPRNKDGASYSYGVYFGMGTTPATFDDYTMENPIASGLSFAGPTAISRNKTAEGIEISATYGICAPSSDITISEMGLFIGQNTTSSVYMVDHTVLETPIVIKAGETKQVTYTIRMNYPK